MEVSVLGTGNVGVAIATDLTLQGHNVTLVKTSATKSRVFDMLLSNGGRACLKENSSYSKTAINDITTDVTKISKSEVIFITIQSTYHEDLIKNIAPYLNSRQVVVCVCSYMSAMYLLKYCRNVPVIAETTGPYLEGRVIDEERGEVVFRVGCRLTRCPLSVLPLERSEECMAKLHRLYKGFSNDYSVVESALLNPNMVLHTVGSVLSIPRIEYSKGDFCMYHEAYARGNDATLKVMLELDEEKKTVLKAYGGRPIDIFDAGGFLGNKMESFYNYSESGDRAISPTSVRSRYITEDVSQGLVLLESMAKFAGIRVPVASALIDITNAALEIDFRKDGRTLERLGAEKALRF